MHNDRTITVRLNGAKFNELEGLARNEGFTVSVIVRHLVYRFLEEKRRYAAVRS